jgi:3-oxoacyl-[acyl-carrier protein] reductase
MKKVALVTGGSRGIGLGIARALAKAGFDLAVNGVRDELSVKEVLAELGSITSVLYCQGNIALREDRSKIIEQTRQRFGRLDVLVNNAGVAPKERRDILEATEESFDDVLSINLKGPYFLTQEIARWMILQREYDKQFHGVVINVSSISATVASVNRGEYCISKAGVAMATQLFAVRLAQHDISVFEVRPGIIATDMTSGVKEKYDKLIEGGLTIQKRWGTPEDVGQAVCSLATGNFPYSTGQVIMVDGGLVVQRL